MWGGGVCWARWGKVGGRGADFHPNSEVSVTRENREFKLHVYGKRQKSS